MKSTRQLLLLSSRFAQRVSAPIISQPVQLIQQFSSQCATSASSSCLRAAAAATGAGAFDTSVVKAKPLSRKYRKAQAKEEAVLNSNIDVSSVALNTLTALPGAKPKKQRVGRGEGSGRGGTSGRGTHGQKARRSVHLPSGFEGGTVPIYRRTPKYGFKNTAFKLEYQPVSLEKLQYFIDTGRIDTQNGTATITMKTLYDAGLVRGIKWPGIKLLSNGKEHFSAKIDIEVPRASKGAIEAIERAGGSIRLIYYQQRALHALLHPERYDGPVKMAMPPPKLFKYYMNPELRGYLADSNPAHPLRDVVPENEKDITRELGVSYLEAYQKKSKGSKKKGGK